MTKLNFSIPGANGRPINLDFSGEDKDNRPLVIFAHGFKGFKDWGTHNLVARYFSDHGLNFLKFNFSHNGVSGASSDSFDDLNAFATNTFSKELLDLKLVVEDSLSGRHFSAPSNIYLIGHSMGGAISIIFTSENSAVTKLCTWASISSFKNLWNEAAEQEWKSKGVTYFLNSRTNQQMPINSTLLDDLDFNNARLDILAAATKINQPWLIINGEDDLAVSAANAQILHQHQPLSKLLLVPKADHVFCAQHPWTSNALPEPLKHVCDKTVDFFLQAT